MKELIIRITNDSDVEVLFNDLITDEVIEKKVSFGVFANYLSLHSKVFDNSKIKRNLKLNNEKILCSTVFNGAEYYVIKQEQHERYITCSLSDLTKALKINFPSSIYIVVCKNKKIESIESYMYFDWNGEKTKIYKYGMPNMLTGNKICIGNAPRDVDNDIIDSLEKIIYAPYTHSVLSNVKGFSSTIEYFNYLSTSKLMEKNLMKVGILKSVLQDE